MQQRARLSLPVMLCCLTLALLAGLWSLTLMRADAARARLERASLAEVGAAAQAYEQYVTRSVANMDQVSLQLKQSWEQSGARLRLGDMRRDGMFVDAAFACVAILDRHGALRTAIRAPACGTRSARAELFHHHRNNNTSALRIMLPGAGQAAVLFSRRLDRADGEFGGAVLVAVRPAYLTSFYLPPALRGGMVASVGAASLPAWGAAAQGAAVLDGAPGASNSARRVLGWRRSPVYPLAGVVTVPHALAMAQHADAWRALRRNATLGSVLIVLLGAAAALLARRAQLREQARSAHLSEHDALTGLPNRLYLMRQLPQMLARAGRAGTDVALLLLDLDDFKYVNDVHGNAAGDALLQGAARRLTSLLRPGDCVVRLDGDEFAVLLVPADGDAHCERVAARIVDAFCTPFTLPARSVALSASLGLALFPHDAGDAAALLKRGAGALAAAKSEGKARYRRYDPALALTLHAHLQFRQSLLDAIEKDQFVLYYQPRVDAASGALRSMEALLRWIDPQRGLVPPLEFIPQAEASGIILPLGELVMDKACAQLAAWRDAGLALVPVSINVSPSQFARGQVHHQLQRALARHGVPAALLEVEITESAMMGEQEHIIAQLAAIRALAVKLHVDDFGTGYSSLSQLQKLKMDVLKVDRAFTAELGRSREGKVFFQAIVSMAHALGMDVVAEGVETAAQLRILQELQCNEVQGYFIARPMPAVELARLLHSGMGFGRARLAA